MKDTTYEDQAILDAFKKVPVGGYATIPTLGTQRLTLNRIDHARGRMKLSDAKAKFVFGKTFRNGQNVFKGITVKRVV